jgi:hypothetical protein
METATRTQRRRRLSLAGVVWTVVLASALSGLVAFSPRAGLSSADALRFERGRLPAGVGTSVESRVDAELALMVSVFSRSRVKVRCWSPADWQRRTSELARPAGASRGAL